MDDVGENPVGNSPDIHSDRLLDLIEFKIEVPTMWLVSCHQATWGKLKRNIDRAFQVEGTTVKWWQDPATYVWIYHGIMPRWFVQEIAALARGELKEYYQMIRDDRTHPSNAMTKRVTTKQKQYQRWHKK